MVSPVFPQRTMVSKGRKNVLSIFLPAASTPRPDAQPNVYRIKKYLLKRNIDYAAITPKAENQV